MLALRGYERKNSSSLGDQTPVEAGPERNGMIPASPPRNESKHLDMHVLVHQRHGVNARPIIDDCCSGREQSELADISRFR